MKNLNIWGYYGVNYGDDIMLQVLVNELQDKKLNISVIQEYDRIDNKIDLKSAKIIKLEDKLSLKNIKSSLKLARNSLNIWGGGTIFTDGDGNFRNFFYVNLLGGDFAYVGIGIGGLTKLSRKMKTKYLLSKCTFATIRDPFSIKFPTIQKNINKFDLVSDLSYCYFDQYRKDNIKEVKNYLLITWRNLEGYYSKSEEIEYMNDTVELSLDIMKNYKINNKWVDEMSSYVIY